MDDRDHLLQCKGSNLACIQSQYLAKGSVRKNKPSLLQNSNPLQRMVYQLPIGIFDFLARSNVFDIAFDIQNFAVRITFDAPAAHRPNLAAVFSIHANYKVMY